MNPTMILPRYFARHYFYWFAGVLAAMLLVVFVGDFVEMLRRTANKDIGFSTVIELAILKQASMAQLVLPFAVLFAGLMSFTRLSRSNELVVTRAAGISAWQFLAPAIVVALAIGVFRVTVFNPFASILTERFETVEQDAFTTRGSLLSLTDSGLWVRQKTTDGVAIIHATSVKSQQRRFEEVIALLFNPDESFRGRIDAASARLEEGYWHLEGVALREGENPPVMLPTYDLPTTLTLDNLQDSFAAPESMSFWTLPTFIRILEEAGFSAQRHRLHFHKLLASPILLCSMVIIAAAFSMRFVRRGGILLIAATGLATGFLTHFMSDLVFALGLSGRIPIELAAWSPAVVTMLLGIALILHLEDG